MGKPSIPVLWALHAAPDPILTALGLALSAGSAHAQTGVATYSFAFGSPAGPSAVTLQPGETVHVFVNAAFSPGVGGGSPPVVGLCIGQFSIAGSGTGAGAWAVNNNTASPLYSLPHPWGWNQGAVPTASVGSPSPAGVSGIMWSYGFLFTTVHTHPQNPANVWRGTFTASSQGVVTTSFSGMGLTGIFAGASGLPMVVYWPSQGLQGQITIIPAPGAIAALAAALAIPRRRRSPITDH